MPLCQDHGVGKFPAPFYFIGNCVAYEPAYEKTLDGMLRIL